MKKGEKAKRARQGKKRLARREALRSGRAHDATLARDLVRDAAQYPLEGCWAQQDWQAGGLAIVTVARRVPNSQVILYAVLLVDYYCLGVKDADVRIEASPERFHSVVLPDLYRSTTVPAPISAALAHELVYGAIDYAARWGFRPHRDFTDARNLLDPREAHAVSGKVAFGYQGQPLYIAGPHDNSASIMAKLERAAGPGHYDFLVGVGRYLNPEELEADDEEEDWDDEPDEGGWSTPPR